MDDIVTYPYPTYLPNKVMLGCVAVVVSISIIAWFIQSCYIRFQPHRLTILVLISQLTIFIKLLVCAAVHADQQNSKDVFTVMNSLFAIGHRMIIVGDFIFLMEIRHEKSDLFRGILIGVMLCIIICGILMVPANMLSFNSDQIVLSFLFRKISALVLLSVTLLLYLV